MSTNSYLHPPTQKSNEHKHTMKVIPCLLLFVVAGWTTGSTNGETKLSLLSLFHVHRRMADKPGTGRQLLTVNCTEAGGPLYKQYFEYVYGASFSCTCVNSTKVMCSSEPFCCGTTCLLEVKTTDEWNSDGFSLFQETCVTFQSGSVEFYNGNTVCSAFNYCNPGGNACSCERSINSDSCNACNVCEDSDTAGDCSNIVGFENLNSTCLDQSQEDVFILQCSGCASYSSALVVTTLAAFISLL